MLENLSASLYFQIENLNNIKIKTRQSYATQMSHWLDFPFLLLSCSLSFTHSLYLFLFLLWRPFCVCSVCCSANSLQFVKNSRKFSWNSSIKCNGQNNAASNIVASCGCVCCCAFCLLLLLIVFLFSILLLPLLLIFSFYFCFYFCWHIKHIFLAYYRISVKCVVYLKMLPAPSSHTTTPHPTTFWTSTCQQQQQRVKVLLLTSVWLLM